VSASMAFVACALLLAIPAVRGLKRVER